MKLSECVSIGIECGLQTYGEAISNIEHQAMSMFAYSEIRKEIQELHNEFSKSSHNLDDSIQSND